MRGRTHWSLSAVLVLTVALGACSNSDGVDGSADDRGRETTDETDPTVSFGGDEGQAAEEPSSADTTPTQGDEPDRAASSGSDGSTTGDAGSPDGEAMAQTVTDFHAAWLDCSADPTSCDPAEAYDPFLAVPGEAFDQWADQIEQWRLAQVVIRTPDGRDDENLLVVTGVEETAAGSGVVSACLRDVRAEFVPTGGGEVELIEATDNPADYRMRFDMEKVDGRWKIARSLTIDTVDLDGGTGLCPPS